MLRISPMGCTDGSIRLKLEGRLVARWVGVLEETCRTHHLEEGTPLILDLSAVSFADPEGLDLLAQLQSDGIRCTAWSPVLQVLYQAASRTDHQPGQTQLEMPRSSKENNR